MSVYMRNSMRTYCCNTVAAASALDAEPEHGENTTTDDDKVTQPVSIARPCCHGKGDVEVGADTAVEDGGHSIADAGHENNKNGIRGGQTGDEDGAGDLPASNGEKIGEPVRGKRPPRPGQPLGRDGVEIGIGPDIWGCNAAVLLWEAPTAGLCESEARLGGSGDELGVAATTKLV